MSRTIWVSLELQKSFRTTSYLNHWEEFGGSGFGSGESTSRVVRSASAEKTGRPRLFLVCRGNEYHTSSW
ncbi:hypothetical protein CH063_03202 [Colletotrichum higginsianum]|uniref:Uncharacterized protein n=1 Tax=Colletotrichum higginsianum (strain IMI 349063) TaxID=759273 RepID=H1VUP7_COLHI|nr:hypothetical protein CH063_03202 [Colletotrichum higginsianum]